MSELFHHAPRLAREPPSQFVVVEARQGVADGVEVGADRETVQHHIVAHVHHRRDISRVHNEIERTNESRGTDAATENRYHPQNFRGAWITSNVVSTTSSVPGWPGDPSYVVFRLNEGMVDVIDAAGPLDEVRRWASVSKMAVSLAFAVEVDWGLHQVSERLGPRGATLANLLSHSSGLGLEPDDPTVEVATKRIYSNYGIDLAVAAIVEDGDAASWLDDRLFTPLGMSSTRLDGRPSSGVIGSTTDMQILAEAWLRPDAVSRDTRNRFIVPYAPHLAGIVPGFGRFSPCPWGLGPEIRGDKSHWMGDWPPESFGHFGKSGSLMLLNVDEGIGVVATSTEDFGAWAVALWPEWTSALRRLALAS